MILVFRDCGQVFGMVISPWAIENINPALDKLDDELLRQRTSPNFRGSLSFVIITPQALSALVRSFLSIDLRTRKIVAKLILHKDPTCVIAFGGRVDTDLDPNLPVGIREDRVAPVI